MLRCGSSSTGAQRLGAVAVPVVRPPASRNVVVPFESVLAVPVIRPEPSRNVFCPLLSVVTVPVIRPLASRMIVCCADAAVANASGIVTHRAMALIGHSFRSNKVAAARSRRADNNAAIRMAARHRASG